MDGFRNELIHFFIDEAIKIRDNIRNSVGYDFGTPYYGSTEKSAQSQYYTINIYYMDKLHGWFEINFTKEILWYGSEKGHGVNFGVRAFLM